MRGDRVEYLASGPLGVYSYRLDNVPWFVPPGHGLLYLTALGLGRSQLFAALRRPVGERLRPAPSGARALA